MEILYLICEQFKELQKQILDFRNNSQTLLQRYLKNQHRNYKNIIVKSKNKIQNKTLQMVFIFLKQTKKKPKSNPLLNLIFFQKENLLILFKRQEHQTKNLNHMLTLKMSISGQLHQQMNIINLVLKIISNKFKIIIMIMIKIMMLIWLSMIQN